jgi:hypothetical protein
MLQSIAKGQTSGPKQSLDSHQAKAEQDAAARRSCFFGLLQMHLKRALWCIFYDILSTAWTICMKSPLQRDSVFAAGVPRLLRMGYDRIMGGLLQLGLSLSW